MPQPVSTDQDCGCCSPKDPVSAKTAGGDGIQKLPTGTPPFTVGDLKNAIPKHCFERSLTTSLGYTLLDLVGVYVLYTLSTYIDSTGPLAFVLWPMYWWWQGAVMTGLWVIAHECGHRAFCDNESVGDAVGLVLHSALLVPYHSWRISHSKHHKNTNDVDHDEVFVPYTRSEFAEGDIQPYDATLTSVVTRMVNAGRMLLFGWPAYLFSHVTGRRYGRHTDHFNPSSPVFSPKDRFDVILSDLVLLAWIGLLCYAGATMGAAWLVKSYVVPYLVVNMWLVLITDLQHTDPKLPHYRGKEWTWLKGALCTLDRDYGVMNTLHHHIGDTHVAHHLFSRMPHYHAQEATEALKKVLGEYYVTDDVAPGLRGIAQALWKTTTFCRFVEDTGGVLWFKDADAKHHHD